MPIIPLCNNTYYQSRPTVFVVLEHILWSVWDYYYITLSVHPTWRVCQMRKRIFGFKRKTLIADIKNKTMASFNYTSTQHSSAYPAIDASSPELSQAGRTVLVTGASFGLGFAAVQGFARASASRIILLGRRPDALVSACERLRAQRQDCFVTSVKN